MTSTRIISLYEAHVCRHSSAWPSSASLQNKFERILLLSVAVFWLTLKQFNSTTRHLWARRGVILHLQFLVSIRLWSSPYCSWRSLNSDMNCTYYEQICVELCSSRFFPTLFPHLCTGCSLNRQVVWSTIPRSLRPPLLPISPMHLMRCFCKG